MPNYTEKLNLFKYDVVADANSTFNITNALNNNWDKIDSGVANVDLSNLSSTGQAKFDAKANVDLSNLSSTGEKHFVNKTQLTNCVLEIPQRVNLVDNGTNIIIKAGTIGIQPNGFEADGSTPKFDYITVTADITLENISTTTIMLGLNGVQNVYRTAIGVCFSGPTAPASPANLAMWYDTSTNLVKRYVSSSWEVANYTLPLGILNYTASGTPGSIQQVFNGFGYIGSSLWIDKGVRMLIPNYRNEDGTLKNQDFTTEKIYLTTYDSDYTRLNGKLVYTRNAIAIYGSADYDSVKNIMINSGNEISGIICSYTDNTIENGVIQSLNIPQTVSLAKNNEVVHVTGNETIYGEKTFENPVNANLGLNVTNDNTFLITLSSSNSRTFQSIRTYNNMADAANLAAGTYGFRVISMDKNNKYFAFVENLVDDDKINRVRIGASRFVDGAQRTASIEACNDTNGNLYGTAPTYTANYADNSSKIVTTQFLTNRWTTSKPTTSSTASKARPAVVIQNYVNGTNWYRVWSDGWIEQGGRAYVYFSASNANEGENVTTISFLKPFTNTNYMPVFTIERYSSEAMGYTDDSTVLIQAVTNNNMKVYCFDGGNNWYHTYIRWRACGY